MKGSLVRLAAFFGALVVVAASLPADVVTATQSRTDSVAAQLSASSAATAGPTLKGNPQCPGEAVAFNPGNGEDIVVPNGYKVERFVSGLNFPTGIAFVGSPGNFKALVIESGRGLPGRCNDPTTWPAGEFDKSNPFTPDLLVFDNHGKPVSGPLAKPTASGGGFQSNGPAIGLAFEHGSQGGTLFASDSGQGIRGARGPNNSSRLLTVDPTTGAVTPFIVHLPTGDHPTENILIKDGFIYWAQGSATNSGVTGHDNGAVESGRQHDIPCQNVTLSGNGFDSGDGHITSGYSDHGVFAPGATRPAFFGAANDPATGNQMHACTGAILRAQIHVADPAATIQPFSWGYRNPYAIRFAPTDHALNGKLLVGTDGEDERGARPTNGSPDRVDVAEMNPDGTPDFHGWPDRFGSLDSTQRVFEPQCGPADDLACNKVLTQDRPVKHVLAFLPQAAKSPIAIEGADSSMVSPDFAPNSFVTGVVAKGAAFMGREGDFGFSPSNSSTGAPEEGHDIQLINFSRPGEPLSVQLQKFAFNCPQANQAHNPDGGAACKQNPHNVASADVGGEQAFPSGGLRGINRPTNVMFGPDGALYLVDYGAVRDFGQSDSASKFTNPADAPLVQIPGTGVIWRISKV